MLYVILIYICDTGGSDLQLTRDKAAPPRVVMTRDKAAPPRVDMTRDKEAPPRVDMTRDKAAPHDKTV